MKTIVAILFALWTASAAFAGDYAIGVLAYNGKREAVERWQPTAEYLTQRIPDAHFSIVPLTLDEAINAINKQKIDFILTNPGHYVRLEVDFGVTRIATFVNRYRGQPLEYFSATIFTRQDSQFDSLESLRGHSFAAVSKDAFGGFQLAQKAFMDDGIDLLGELEMKWMGFPHADIVNAVLDGYADAGIVRAGVLEKMAANGHLDLSQIRILEPARHAGYPFLHSVGMYPEWPFAKLPHMHTDLSKAVARELLQMNENTAAARAAGGSGWTIPMTYSSIHDVLSQLQAAPYTPASLDMATFFETYRDRILLVAILFVTILGATFWLFRTNLLLQKTQRAFQQQQGELEFLVRERTDELLEINQSLQLQIDCHVEVENTLREGCEALKSMYSVLIRDDLDRHQKVTSMLNSIRLYLGAEFGVLSRLGESVEYEPGCVSPGNSNVGDRLSPEFFRQAIQSRQIVTRENVDNWRAYVACPVFIGGELAYVLEFGSTDRRGAEIVDEKEFHISDLTLNILGVVGQWIGAEYRLLEQEKRSLDRATEVRQRLGVISPRERQVLSLLSRGESSKTMARMLDISPKTVEMHRANLLRKTNAKSSTELVQLAVISGIFERTQ